MDRFLLGATGGLASNCQVIVASKFWPCQSAHPGRTSVPLRDQVSDGGIAAANSWTASGKRQLYTASQQPKSPSSGTENLMKAPDGRPLHLQSMSLVMVVKASLLLLLMGRLSASSALDIDP
jgi:hypothetical protein